MKIIRVKNIDILVGDECELPLKMWETISWQDLGQKIQFTDNYIWDSDYEAN